MEDLLMWIRAQRGRIPFDPKAVSLSEILNNITEALNHESSLKNIEIRLMTASDICVFADISMLKTILRNLVSNAIKFTHKGGKITINAMQEGSFTKICVSDNGTGIKPENSAKLFDISQVYTTRGTEEEGGTGLGLLICKELVEKHNGKIWVESEYGRGTTFYFTVKNIIHNE
jgi:signal transduction histidine kinase